MKATETYGFPYPECDPPLVKDASQITQFGALANAIDAEVERIATMAEDNIIQPPAARLFTSAPTATTATLVTVAFDTTVFSRNWGFAPPLFAGELEVNETGWYLVGAHGLTDSATAMQTNVRLVRNGVAASSWSNPGGVYTGAFQLPALGVVPLQLADDDRLTVQIKHNAAAGTSWNYRAHLWAVKLVTV